MTDAGLKRRRLKLRRSICDWVKSIASFVNRRIFILSATMSTQCTLVFGNPDVAAELVDLNDKFVVVPADKVSNNIVFVFGRR